MGRKKSGSSAAAFKVGAVSLAFMTAGYQIAVFVHQASVEKVAADRDRPDTVFVIDSALAASLLEVRDGGPASAPAGVTRKPGGTVSVRRESAHSPVAGEMRERSRHYENFRFNPNEASSEDLVRLGFTGKQAQAIINYREKGGRFRRREDFAKSFVVADSVYRRLEPFIDIPKIDINTADSAAFDALPGIGGWFAARMVSYRNELGGYSYPEQLMDIWHFDREKFDALSDLVECSPPRTPFALWTLPADSLRRHPYIRTYQTARAVVLFRENSPKEDWTVEKLAAAGILSDEAAAKLSRCAIACGP